MEEIIKDVKTLELLKEEIRIVIDNNRNVKARIEKLKKLGYKILVKENFKGCSYKTSRS